jgi:hypothetical protein
MSDDNKQEKPSGLHRPGTPGYALLCIRHASGLARVEAAQLCNLGVPLLKSIELYDEGNAFLWGAIESRYHMVLEAEERAAQLGIKR